MKRHLWWLSLSALVILGVWLRLLNLEELFYFTHDEETVAWRVMPLLRDKNLFLLGGVTPLHVHLGPWFYYLSAAILWIGKLNPISWGVAGAVVSAGTMALLYLLVRTLSGHKAGIIAVLLYATSFVMNAFDRHWWALAFDPLVSLVVIYSLVKITQGKKWYSLWLALGLALGFHSDPSTWALLLLSLTVWLWQKIPVNKATVVAICLFLASFLPLILFDLTHQGQNLLGYRQYLTETRPHQGLSLDRFIWSLTFIPRSLSRLIYPTTTDLAETYAYCPKYSHRRIAQTPWLFVAISTAVLGYFLLKPRQHLGEKIINLYLIIVIIGLNLYGNFFTSDLFDHYLATLFPLFFLMIATNFFGLNRNWRYLVIPTLILFVVINGTAVSRMTNRVGWKDKLMGVNWAISQLKGQPFALDSLGACFRYNGTRYLFTYYQHEPSLSFVDPNFFWLYTAPSSTQYPDKLVVFVTSKDLNPDQQNQYVDYLSHTVKRRSFTGLEVLIVDNFDQKFSIKF